LLDTFIERDETYWQSRVTLKIDVPFTDHSHIIGRQGRNTQRVMKETGCHIHFPDSNKNQDMDKSNQVSVAGPLNNVENARHMIRDLAPLTVTFELKQLKAGVDPQSLIDHPALESLTQTEDLHVLVRHNRSSGQPFALVRGSAHQERTIRNAVHKLQDLVFHKGTPVMCSLSLEILQPQQETVKGPNNSNIHVISQRTGAQIHFPTVERSGATTFYIQGPLDSILAARRHIIGCLPVFMMFELRSDQGMNPSNWEMEHNVIVSIKQKRGSDSKTVLIRSLESNLTNVYAVRRKLMGSVAEAEPVVLCPDYAFMSELSCPQAAAAAALLSGLAGPMGALTVNTGPRLHLPPILSPLTQLPPTLFQVSPDACPTSGYVSSESVPGPSSDGSRQHTPNDDDDDTQIIVGTAATLPHSPPRPTARVLEEEMKPRTPGTPNDPVPGCSPLASAVFRSAQNISRNNGRTDWKAPGAERSGGLLDRDTEHLFACRHMQAEPQGPRTPTGYWTGMGFSRTMPDGVLRSQLPIPEEEEEVSEGERGGRLARVDENAELTGTLGPWPVGVNASPVYNRQAFMATMHFEQSLLPEASQALRGLVLQEDLPALLTAMNFGQYLDFFVDQEVDFATFLTLSEEDLKSIGINTIGARRKIMSLIDSLLSLIGTLKTGRGSK
jgi:protein bicaudal C